MDDMLIHGVTLWTTLISTAVNVYGNLFSCWKRLIGRPIRAFFSKEGLETSVRWLEDGPHRLDTLGEAQWLIN